MPSFFSSFSHGYKLHWAAFFSFFIPWDNKSTQLSFLGICRWGRLHRKMFPGARRFAEAPAPGGRAGPHRAGLRTGHLRGGVAPATARWEKKKQAPCELGLLHMVGQNPHRTPSERLFKIPHRLVFSERPIQSLLNFIWWVKIQIGSPPVNLRFNPTTKLGFKIGWCTENPNMGSHWF